MSKRYVKPYKPYRTSRLNGVDKDFSNPLSNKEIFNTILAILNKLCLESGKRGYPYLELLNPTHPESKFKKWYLLRFPIIRTVNPENSLEWEYFTLGYDPKYRMSTEKEGMWWYMFSGYAGSCYSHPFLKNPFYDHLGKSLYGCIVLEDVHTFLNTQLYDVLNEYTLTMPLEDGESFTI